MTYRPDDVVPKKPLPRHRGLAAVALAVTAVLVGPAVAAAPAATQASIATRAPASQPVDWNRRIDEALVATGDLTKLASELDTVAGNSIDIVNAKLRVAVEKGDLLTAGRLAQQAVEQQPADAALQSRLAYFQELVGNAAAARQTLERAVAAPVNSPATDEMLMRLAVLALDEGRNEDGLKWLDRAAASGAMVGRAGFVAYVFGDYPAAAKYLHGAEQSEATDVSLPLLEGNAALRAGQNEAAKDAFSRAFVRAIKPADRAYAQERIITAARQANTLSGLADTWLADKNLPADRMMALATVLRELGRVPDLLDWWKSASTNPARASTVLSDRFVREVVGAAQSAGRSDDAIAICKDLSARNPGNPQWLSATLQALTAAGRMAEADELLLGQINATSTSADLDRLARLARTLGRDETAIAAARRLAGPGDKVVAGLLMEASVRQRAGDTAASASLLEKAATLAPDHLEDMGQIVSALEGAGLETRAIDILQQSVAKNASEESLGRLASLLLKQKKNAEAAVVLERLMRTDASVAVRSQAAQRLLDASIATNTVPALIDRLRARLDSNAGTPQDLSLLIDAYIRKGDLTSATAMLRQSKLLDEPTRLSRLAVVYLRSKKLDDAAAVLRQLVIADPDEATETLERLAGVELDRKRPDEAAKVIEQIRSRIGDSQTSSELMAGVLDRLGRPAEAAAAYRRAVAANPQNADNWLLWSTALKKAKHGSLARNRLQVLCGEAETDNVFGTAVDGLLNLDASGNTLRVARRDAILRAAKRPDRMILFHVIADLADELQDTAMVVRAADASVSFSDEERPQRLRELMDVASQKGSVDMAVDCGRTLLALGDDFPPQLFLQLSEQLLIAGRSEDAARALTRAAESSDPDLIAPRAATLYEKYAYPAAALNALRPVADRRKNDGDFREAMGRLNEIAGDADAAFDNYLASAAIISRDVAAEKTLAFGNRTSQSANGVQNIILMSMGMGMSPQMQGFNRVVGGAIASASTASQRTALLDLLRGAVDPLVNASEPAEGPTNGLMMLVSALRRASFAFAMPDVADAMDEAVIRRWPKLDVLVRQAFDARAQEGMVTRALAFAAAHGIDAGSAAAGVRLTPAAAPSTRPDETISQVASMQATPTTEPTTGPAGMTPAQAAAVLPAMIAQGQSEQAKVILANLLPVVPPPPRAVAPSMRFVQQAPTLQTIVTAAAALGDRPAVTKWALFWLRSELASQRKIAQPDPAVTSQNGRSTTRPTATRPTGPGAGGAGAPGAAGGATASAVTQTAVGTSVTMAPGIVGMQMASGGMPSGLRAVSGAWPFLDSEGRSQIVDELLTQAGPKGEERFRGVMAMAALQTAGAISRNLPDAVGLAAAALKMPGYGTNLPRTIALVPVADRPEVLRRAMAQVPPQGRLNLLTGFVSILSDPLDDATRAFIADAARDLPADQTFTWTDWFMNPSQKAVLPDLASAIVRSAPSPATAVTGGSLTAAAAAFRVAGDDRADATAIAAIAVLRTPPPPPDLEGPNPVTARMVSSPMPERGGLLRVAVAALSPKARDRMLDEVNAISSGAFVAQPDRVWAALLGSTLLDAAGRRSESLATLRAAFAADSSDTAVVHAYADRLVDDGRLAELVAVFGQRAAGSDMTFESSWAKQLVARAMQGLYRWREIRAATENQFGLLISTDMVAQSAVNDTNGLAASLRALLIGVRGGRTAIVPDAPDPGGLQTKPDTRNDGTSEEPAAILTSAVQWPDAAEKMIKAVNVPSDSGIFFGVDTGSWVTTLLARASAADPKLCERVMQSVRPAVMSHTLNRAQRRLIAALAVHPEINVPADWLDELWPAALTDDSGTELQRLGQALAARHLPGAEDALRWVATLQLTSQRARMSGSGTSLPSPLDGRPDDLALSATLASICETDPAAAESWLTNARATGGMGGRYPSSTAIWARLAAERGDVPAFEARISGLLQSWTWQRITPTPGFVMVGKISKLDLRSALPPHVMTAKVRSDLLDALHRQMDALAALWSGNPEIPRQMAALGAWAVDQGDRDAGAIWFDRAKALSEAQGPGENQLWVADLARRLGQTTVATEMERKLMEQRCLPAARMASLLAQLQKDGATEIARRLAADAMTYCREPTLVSATGG